MNRRYPAEIRRTISLAEKEARQLNHEFIGTEHLLLGLAADESSLAATVLRKFDVDHEKVRHEVELLILPGTAPPPATALPLTPRAKQAVEFASEESQIVCSDDVTTGHLLVGLARETDGIAGHVLRKLGLTAEAIWQELLKFRVLQMKIVERAVRPIRCGFARKRKMREELLAHLTEIYEEELPRLDDPRAAIDETARRFGDPAELATALENSLPPSERRKYYFERWFGWRAPETAASWMARLAVQLLLFLAALCALGIAVDVIIAGPAIFQWNVFRGILAFVVLMPLVVCGQGVLFYKMRDAMFGVFGSRKSLARVLWLQVLAVLLIVGCSVAYLAFAEWSLATIVSSLPPLAIAAIFVANTIRFTARFTGPTEIRDTYWACLDIHGVCES